MSAWLESATPHEDALHVIENAVFELTFQRGIVVAGDERELASIVQTELMSVVAEVFEESGTTDGTLNIDELEVDLGSLTFDGSWSSVRERLREGLRTAINRARWTPTAEARGRLRAVSAKSSASDKFDTVAQFLRFGVLPSRTRIQEGWSIDALLADVARTAPRRLSTLIHDQALTDDVAVRLARQFSEPTLRRVAEVLFPDRVSEIEEFLDNLKSAFDRMGSGADWNRGIGQALWSRLLKDFTAQNPPLIEVTIKHALEDAALGLDQPFREFVVALAGRLKGSGRVATVVRRLASTANEQPEMSLAPTVDTNRLEPTGPHNLEDLARELEQSLPRKPGLLLEQLRSRNISLSALSARLSTAGHLHLLKGAIAATADAAGDVSELAIALEEYAQRANDQRAFYRRVIERLVADELIDLDAIAEGAARPQTHPQDRAEADEGSPSLAVSEHLLRGYDLFALLTEPEHERPALTAAERTTPADVIEELAQSHPDQLKRLLVEMRSGALSFSQFEAQLSGAALRVLAHAFVSLREQAADTDRSQLARSMDDYARRASSERVFYSHVLEHFISNELIDLEAIAASNAPSVEPIESDSAASPRSLEILVQELEDRQPTKFKWLHEKLRSGEISLATLSERLSTPGLRHLFSELLATTAQGGHDVSEFRKAVETHAHQTDNERAFYRQVLERLLNDDLIDLEAIAESGRAAHERAALSKPSLQSRSPDASLMIRNAASAEAESETLENAFRDYLRNGTVLPAEDRDSLLRLVEERLSGAQSTLGTLLRECLQSEASIGRLVRLLPERLLTRALFQLAPSSHGQLQRYADAIANACHDSSIAIGPRSIAGLKWRFCFQYLIAAQHEPDMTAFVHQFTEFLAAHSQQADAAKLRAMARPWLGEIKLKEEGIEGLRADRLNTSKTEPGETVEPDAAFEYLHLPYRKRHRELLGQGVRIGNAGQVLAAPYLPRLFGMLGLVEEGAFKSATAQERAVHLLQFLVDGSCETAEYELILNKVLCGLDTAKPVSRGIVVTEDEKEAIEGLLRGMIQNWKVLKSTSVSGLRESFLKRDGTLRTHGDGWQLSVDPKAFDMLLDQIPWGYSTIKHSWMEEVIYVVWR